MCTKRAPLACARSIIHERPAVKYPWDRTNTWENWYLEVVNAYLRLSWVQAGEFHRLPFEGSTFAVMHLSIYPRFDTSASYTLENCSWLMAPTGFGFLIVTRSGPENVVDRHVLIAWGIRASSPCWSDWYRFRKSPWSKRDAPTIIMRW